MKFYFLFIILFFVYLNNLSVYVVGGDVGDFLTAVAVQGVAHPSGYPVIILLGLLFKHLPIDATLAWKVGLISSIASVVSVYFFFRSSLLLTKNTLISLISASTLAFLYPFWLHAEIAEVFALAYMFHIILLYLTLRYVYKKEQKTLYLISLFSGLALANHQIVISFLPVIFLTLLWVNFRIFLRLKIVLLLVGLFVVGLSPYLYVFLTPNFNFPINWGNQDNFYGVLKHILRMSYGWSPHIIEDQSIRMFHMNSYVLYSIKEITPIIIVFAFIGLFFLIIRKQLILILFFVSSFILIGPLFIFYASVPVLSLFLLNVYERFYVFSYIFILIIASIGVHESLNFLRTLLIFKLKNKNVVNSIIFISTIILFIIPISLFLKNLGKTNLSRASLGEYTAEDILMTLPYESSLSLNYDSIAFNIHYLQQAKNYRRDVILENHYDRKKTNKNFMKTYNKVSQKYKKMRKSDKLLMTYFILRDEHNFFSQAEYQFDSSDREYEVIYWIPYGLLSKIASDDEVNMNSREFFDYQKSLWDRFRIGSLYKYPKAVDYNFSLLDIKYHYGLSATRVADYIRFKYNDEEKAVYFDKKALEISPYIVGSYGKVVEYLLSKSNCTDSEVYVKMYYSYNLDSESSRRTIEKYEKKCN